MENQFSLVCLTTKQVPLQDFVTTIDKSIFKLKYTRLKYDRTKVQWETHNHILSLINYYHYHIMKSMRLTSIHKLCANVLDTHAFSILSILHFNRMVNTRLGKFRKTGSESHCFTNFIIPPVRSF